jgi:hypothetical protein
VAREHAELVQAFTVPPNVFDGFRRAEEVAFEARARAAEARLIDELSSLATLGSEIASLRQAFEAQAQASESQLSNEQSSQATLSAEIASLRQTLEAQAQAAETRLIDVQSGQATLGSGITSLRQALEVERDQRAALFASLHSLLAQVQWSREPLWIQLLFRASGKPKKLLRRMLFHTNGKPRKVSRPLVLHLDGHPRSPFRRWMSSPEYQSLRAAVRQSGQAGMSAGWQGDGEKMTLANLSPDAERVARRLAALRHAFTYRG